MRKLIPLVIILLLSLKGISQKNEMSDANKNLLEHLIAQEEERQERIENYLENNPNYVIEKSNDIFVSKSIYDIIDNKPVYRSTYNFEASIATGAVHLQPGGSLNLNLDGTGMMVGVWDGGPVQSSHVEFQDQSSSNSRVTNLEQTTVDGASEDDAHATHVTGTINANGADPSAKGMAPGAEVITYNFNNDLPEILQAVANHNLILSNHSYGVPADNVDPWFMGAYLGSTRDVDLLHYNNPNFLMVMSAGNAGQYVYEGGLFQGFDKLTGDKNSKNALIIANANPSVNPVTQELVVFGINQGSSEGPTDDLRIKPDIAADGTNLFSPVPPDSYDTFTGTSMSAPNTTGTLLLIQQYYNQVYGNFMKSATLRGLVCHTAIDDNSTPGPDPIFGWGFLNGKEMANVITDSNMDASIIIEDTLTSGTPYTLTFNAEAGEKLIATLCWTDLEGNPVANGTLNDTTPQLVNDLDIRLTDGNQTYFPWRLDYDTNAGFSNSKGDNIRDNVEKIEIDVPSTGEYTLTITNKGILLPPGESIFDPTFQDFSLIVTGNNITLNNESFSLNQIKIFPNPTTDFISVSGLTDEFEYDVFNIQGKVLNNGKIDSINNQIDLSSLSNGIYIVRINNGDNFITKKIIKK